MKRKFAAVLLLASALMSSGCSIICEFIVVNDSDAPLEVRYTHKPSAMPHEGRFQVPGVVGAGRVDDSGKEWRQVPPERYTIDYKTGHVWVKVLPGEALRVAEITNYSGHDRQSDDSLFHIDSLSLDGARGSAKYQGRQAMTQFVDTDGGTYVIRYR
jgi:hypothetical protein